MYIQYVVDLECVGKTVLIYEIDRTYQISKRKYRRCTSRNCLVNLHIVYDKVLVYNNVLFEKYNSISRTKGNL